jgi:hypothetical protein
MGYSLDRFFQDAQLRDVLDAITHIYATLKRKGYHPLADAWYAFVVRAMAEEHTSYVLEVDGSVTYVVDEAYGAARRATLAGLADARWLASRSEFERAFEAMDQTPSDTNGAIRAIAAAVESATKIVLNNAAASIGTAEIERFLWPLVQNVYDNDQSAQISAHQLLKSYADWVVASHQYRHGQGHANEVRAPEELTIAMLSVGSAILRWIVQFDVLVRR